MAVSADLYRTFLGVGLYLSFSRAAKELGVSQSAIGQSIKQLEGELNMPLSCALQICRVHARR